MDQFLIGGRYIKDKSFRPLLNRREHSGNVLGASLLKEVLKSDKNFSV